MDSIRQYRLEAHRREQLLYRVQRQADLEKAVLAHEAKVEEANTALAAAVERQKSAGTALEDVNLAAEENREAEAKLLEQLRPKTSWWRSLLGWKK